MSQITKKALAASLKTLLQKKPLSQITISEITEGCGVNRMTFYYHFKDIYDLVEWICVEDAAGVLDGKKTAATWQQGYLNIFHTLRKNSSLIINLSRSDSRDRIKYFLNKLVYNLMIDVVEEQSAGMEVTENEKNFIADFYKYALVGILLNWIDRDMKEEPGQIVNRVSAVVSENIIEVLKKYQDNIKRRTLFKK